MFERLRRLFGGGRRPKVVSDAARPDPFVVPYRDQLPGRMREAHAALRAALELAQDAERRGEPGRVLAHLAALDQLLRGYLAEPAAEFHDYLAGRIASDRGRLQVLRSARARLRLVARDVRESVQPRRGGDNGEARRVGARTLQDWATTLRDTLLEVERDLLPSYLPPDESGR